MLRENFQLNLVLDLPNEIRTTLGYQGKCFRVADGELIGMKTLYPENSMPGYISLLFCNIFAEIDFKVKK